MKLENYEWNAFIRMVKTAPDAKTAKVLFEMWLDEKMQPVYKRGWKDACNEYDIEDTMDWYDEEGEDDYWLPEANYDEF